MDAVRRKILFATPPKGGSLRDALPFVERLWRGHVGERAMLTLGWGSEPAVPTDAGIEELGAWIARWEAERRLVLGEGDVHVDAPGCQVLFCHDADLHIQSADPALLSEAKAVFTALNWQCVEAEKREPPL